MTESIERFNKYKSVSDAAANALSRAYQHLIKPTEGFPYHSNQNIAFTWREWVDAEEVLWHMTRHGDPPARVFPPPPPEGPEYKACRQMWGCLLQEQVEGQSDSTAVRIKDAVKGIVLAMKTHDATCSCKVPRNPWTWASCVDALEPLNIKHNAACTCAGGGRCLQKGQARESAEWRAHRAKTASDILLDKWLRENTALKLTAIAALGEAKSPQEALEKAEATLSNAEGRLEQCVCDARYSGRVGCSCRPHREVEVEMARDNLKALKAEIALGYYREDERGFVKIPPQNERLPYIAAGFDQRPRQHGSSVAAPVAAPVAVPAAVPLRSTYDYQHNVDTCPCGTCHKARVDSGTADAYLKRCQENARLALERLAPSTAATSASGRSIESDFAKEIFAAMGTPYDSRCPHGIPYYACMSCSH